jgi:putative component of membrane protein insertase Oxa1/YidC/SpoIIIJ protein YidD
MKRVALAAIRGYQRWISPHKGFCCALRAATGGDSCSAYGYQVIARFGLRSGLGLLDRRLALCGHVHRRSGPLRPAPAVRNPWRHKEQGHCDVPCDSPSCDLPSCDLPDLSCGPGHGHACACGDFLDLANCGSIGGCGDSNHRAGRVQRDSTQLDALARRIKKNKEKQKPPPPAPK